MSAPAGDTKGPSPGVRMSLKIPGAAAALSGFEKQVLTHLDQFGSIANLETVPKFIALAETMAKNTPERQLLMLEAIHASREACLAHLIQYQLLRVLKQWLKEARAAKQNAVLLSTLQLLSKLPVTFDAVQTAKLGQPVIALSSKLKDGELYDDADVRAAADRLVKQWKKLEKSEAAEPPLPHVPPQYVRAAHSTAATAIAASTSVATSHATTVATSPTAVASATTTSTVTKPAVSGPSLAGPNLAGPVLSSISGPKVPLTVRRLTTAAGSAAITPTTALPAPLTPTASAAAAGGAPPDSSTATARKPASLGINTSAPVKRTASAPVSGSVRPTKTARLDESAAGAGGPSSDAVVDVEDEDATVDLNLNLAPLLPPPPPPPVRNLREPSDSYFPPTSSVPFSPSLTRAGSGAQKVKTRKRVTWASGADLLQIREFQSDVQSEHPRVSVHDAHRREAELERESFERERVLGTDDVDEAFGSLVPWHVPLLVRVLRPANPAVVSDEAHIQAQRVRTTPPSIHLRTEAVPPKIAEGARAQLGHRAAEPYNFPFMGPMGQSTELFPVLAPSMPASLPGVDPSLLSLLHDPAVVDAMPGYGSHSHHSSYGGYPDASHRW